MILNSLFKLIEEKSFSPFPYDCSKRSISAIPFHQKGLLEKKTTLSQRSYFLHEINQLELPQINFTNKLNLFAQSHHISIYQYGDPSDSSLSIFSPLHYTLLLAKKGEYESCFCVRIYFNGKLNVLNERAPFELVPLLYTKGQLSPIPLSTQTINHFTDQVKFICKPFFDELKKFLKLEITNIIEEIHAVNKSILSKTINFKGASQLFSKIQSDLYFTSQLKFSPDQNIHQELNALETKINQINPVFQKKEASSKKETFKFLPDSDSDSDSEITINQYRQELNYDGDTIQNLFLIALRSKSLNNFIDSLKNIAHAIRSYESKLKKYSDDDNFRFKKDLATFKEDFQKALALKIECMIASSATEKEIFDFIQKFTTTNEKDLYLLDLLPIDLFKEILFSNKIEFFEILFLNTSNDFQKKFVQQYMMRILNELSADIAKKFLLLLDNRDFLTTYEHDQEKLPLFVFGLNHFKDSYVKLFRQILNESYFFFDSSIQAEVKVHEHKINIPSISSVNHRLCFDVSEFKQITCTDLHTQLISLNSTISKAQPHLQQSDKKLSILSIFETTIVGEFFIWLLKEPSTHPGILFNIFQKYQLASNASEFLNKIKTLKNNIDSINKTINEFIKNPKDTLTIENILNELNSKSLSIFSLKFSKALLPFSFKDSSLTFSTSMSKKNKVNKSQKKLAISI